MADTYYFGISITAVFLITAFLTKKIIPVLKSMKMGQKILDIGPRWHKSKEGTPTMGGVSFLVAMPLVSLILVILSHFLSGERVNSLIITIAFCILNSLVGITDDLTKIRKKQNAGLSPKQKLVLQLAIAAAYLAVMRIHGCITTQLYIPFLNFSVELGYFYYFFAVVLILGVVNCANLTDGIDGLASVVAFGIGFFFSCSAMRHGNISILIISGGLCGAALGFLVYNFHPAKVFMGDTGSLFLGAVTVGCAFMINNPLIILICGIVYVIEGASVIIQVCVYKICKRRVFKMAPIHHHFEKCGMKENSVVLLFFIITVIFSFVASLALR